jgi:hypothetical protein
MLATVLAGLVVSSIVDVVREARFPAPQFGFGGQAPRVRHWWSFSLGGFQLLNDMVIAMGVLAGDFARAYSVSARARQGRRELRRLSVRQVTLCAPTVSCSVARWHFCSSSGYAHVGVRAGRPNRASHE